ncbi:hypothetical protein FRC00_006612 [Tulasnella sp. 408]|nr:hypothetical protein FRC00_006612 [Tulasnella sp. 408]
MSSGSDTPQWGRPGEHQSLHETYWDAEQGAIKRQNTRKNTKPTPLKLPPRDAAVVSGLILLIGKLGTRPEWDSDYAAAAQHYIIDVLDDFFTANIKAQKGRKQEYSGLTEAMKVLWRSSCEGVDLINLRRGADIHPKSTSPTMTNEWRVRPTKFVFTEKPGLLALAPRVFGM